MTTVRHTSLPCFMLFLFTASADASGSEDAVGGTQAIKAHHGPQLSMILGGLLVALVLAGVLAVYCCHIRRVKEGSNETLELPPAIRAPSAEDLLEYSSQTRISIRRTRKGSPSHSFQIPNMDPEGLTALPEGLRKVLNDSDSPVNSIKIRAEWPFSGVYIRMNQEADEDRTSNCDNLPRFQYGDMVLRFERHRWRIGNSGEHGTKREIVYDSKRMFWRDATNFTIVPLSFRDNNEAQIHFSTSVLQQLRFNTERKPTTVGTPPTLDDISQSSGSSFVVEMLGSPERPGSMSSVYAPYRSLRSSKGGPNRSTSAKRVLFPDQDPKEFQMTVKKQKTLRKVATSKSGRHVMLSPAHKNAKMKGLYSPEDMMKLNKALSSSRLLHLQQSPRGSSPDGTTPRTAEHSPPSMSDNAERKVQLRAPDVGRTLDVGRRLSVATHICLPEVSIDVPRQYMLQRLDSECSYFSSKDSLGTDMYHVDMMGVGTQANLEGDVETQAGRTK